jgi:hypothetical protein
MGELDELREEIEELKEEIQELKEDSSEEEEEGEEDENRDLYIYIQYVCDTVEVLGVEHEERKTLLVEDDNSYSIPQTVEADYASTTRQVIEYIKSRGVDVWESVERCGERDSAVYYRVLIPGSIASEVCGAWVSRQKADNMTSMEAREYL